MSISSHTWVMLKVVNLHGYDDHNGLHYGVQPCSVHDCRRYEKKFTHKGDVESYQYLWL